MNHQNPPPSRIRDLFRRGNCRQHYSKARDAGRILRDNDLLVSAQQCSELRALLNTILRLCGGEELTG